MVGKTDVLARSARGNGLSFGADHLVRALKAKRVGSAWMACCPAHRDRTPSLSITTGRDGKVLVHCFAGCAQDDVIAQLKQDGLWVTELRGGRPDVHRPQRRSGDRRTDQERPSDVALSIWQASRRADGTLVGTYLARRGLRLSPPPALRFHPGLKHPSGKVWP